MIQIAILTRISTWISSYWRLCASVARAVRVAVKLCIAKDETRTGHLQRATQKEKEVRGLADKIMSYGRSVHRRYPSGVVVVGEDDLAALLGKPQETVGTALNMLLSEQKVQKALLGGYWKLSA